MATTMVEAATSQVRLTKRVSYVHVTMVRETVARPQVHNPDDVAAIVRDMIEDADRETFVAVLLDTKHRVTAVHVAGVGVLDACLVTPREVFKAAILSNAAAVIVAHNHPSGDPTPSPDDVAMTARLIKAGSILGIEVLDALVVGAGRVCSFRAEGLWPGD